MKRLRICCLGAGYVGGPTMAVIAHKCPDIDVTVLDLDPRKIGAWQSKQLPVYEPGLDSIVRECLGRNLFFSTNIEHEIELADIVFVSVNTPTKTFGVGAGKASDMQFWESAARMIANASSSSKIIVEKSTVPVKTAAAIEKVRERVCSFFWQSSLPCWDVPHAPSFASFPSSLFQVLENNCKSPSTKFAVLSNPEFLAEGTAIQDLFHPDRVLIGGRDDEDGAAAMKTLASVYERWVPRENIILANIWSAELTKLAANAMLAQRISSINALTELCERTGADIEQVSACIGRDSRIGSKFLKASVGFGGSCFQKDILNLAYICESLGLHNVANYWQSVVGINEHQKERFVRRMIKSMFQTVSGKRIAVLGYALKKDTNDIRESPAIDVCKMLLDDGATIAIHDPRVQEHDIFASLGLNRRNPLADISQGTGKDADKVSVSADVYGACRNAHAIVILTEWEEFKAIDFKHVYHTMKTPAYVFDGRNIVDLAKLRAMGFIANGVGRPVVNV